MRFLLVVVGLIAVAAAAWGLTRSPLFDLDHVHIEGVEGDDLRTVEDVLAFGTGTAMFDLDLGAARRELTALPWVLEAETTRDWPGTVRVRVTPRIPVAVIGQANGPRRLADAHGVLIGDAPASSTLPRVAVTPTVALGAVEEAALDGLVVALAMPADLYPWVDAVTVAHRPGADERPIVGLDLIGEAVVEMGGATLVEDKLAAVRAVLDSADLRCVAVIDVAVADLTTVTRDPVCENGDSADETAEATSDEG